MLPILLPLAVAAAQLPAQAAVPAAKAVETITAADVARHLGVIAADSTMGRDTPSRGLEVTARYIADQFKRFGLKPGGENGSWFQRYPLSDDTATAPNTVGILEGSDPKLKDEYVVISAHMDHIGITSGGADSINNGAYDNGSGTVGVIELAEALSQPGARPRRSIIFLTLSGEEKGLRGSSYFVENPVVPIKQIVADLNLDGIGLPWKDTVVVIGQKHSDLGATLQRVNAAHPELHVTPVDDPWPEEQFLFRSDHYSFARRGVPFLYFMEGLSPDVHQVTDSPEKIDTDKVARIVRLVFHLGREVGDADPKPKWDDASYKQIVQQP